MPIPHRILAINFENENRQRILANKKEKTECNVKIRNFSLKINDKKWHLMAPSIPDSHSYKKMSTQTHKNNLGVFYFTEQFAWFYLSIASIDNRTFSLHLISIKERITNIKVLTKSRSLGRKIWYTTSQEKT